jgi:L-iditol 2-dehydrogenase
MKAAVITGVGRVEVREIARPEIQAPDEVLLRTAVAGLCGSDLHYFIADRVGGEAVPYPVVGGHEASAVVEAVGPAVTRVRPGDRVAVEPSISCGSCDQCRAGRPHTCRSIKFLGHPGDRHGALAEFFVLPERNLFPVPVGMTMAEAMLAEPLSIALHALQLGGGYPGPTVAVLGTGPIGLCVLLCLRAAGVRDLYAADRSEARIQAALKAGAVWSGNPDRQDVACGILERRPLGMDAVFEASGDPAAVEQAIEMVKPGGRITLIGIPLEERIAYPTAVARRKEIAFHNVRRQNRCIERALLLIENRHIDVAWLMTHTFAIDEAPRAFEIASRRTDGILKAAVLFA